MRGFRVSPIVLDWTPELISIIAASILTPILTAIVTLAAMYYKHQMDMAEYQRNRSEVKQQVREGTEAVKEKLDNGIKSAVENNAHKLDELIETKRNPSSRTRKDD